MDPRLLRYYERELQYVREMGAEYTQDYPKIAARLGMVGLECADPYVERLLEGFAFLAARVQLKLKHEFPEFTNNLIEQLLPNYLAPTPSALLAGVVPTYSDPALREGMRIPRGSYIDATYLERERRVACRYRLGGDVTKFVPPPVAEALKLVFYHPTKRTRRVGKKNEWHRRSTT